MMKKIILTLSAIFFIGCALAQNSTWPYMLQSSVQANDTLLVWDNDSTKVVTAGGLRAIDNALSVSGNGVYTTIQSAINAASAGDVVLAYAGSYAESLSISKKLSLQAMGKCKVHSIKITAGDTVSVSGFDIYPGASDTLMYINSSSVVFINNVYLENTINNNRVFVINSGTLYANNLNIKHNQLSGRVEFNGGNSVLSGDYIYTVGPTFSNAANVTLDYDRLALNGFVVSDTAIVRLHSNMLRDFDTSTWADVQSAGGSTMTDSVFLNVQSNNLSVAITNISKGDLRVYNSYGDYGRPYFANFYSGNVYLSNSHFTIKSDLLSNHFIESADTASGSIILTNNFIQWRSGLDGTTGTGSPIYIKSGNFESYNDTYIDYGLDSASAAYANIILIECAGYKTIIDNAYLDYRGPYTQQTGIFLNTYGVNPADVSITNTVINTTGDPITSGNNTRSWDTDDVVNIENVIAVRGGSVIAYNASTGFGIAMGESEATKFTALRKSYWMPIGLTAMNYTDMSLKDYASDLYVLDTLSGSDGDTLLITIETVDGTGRGNVTFFDARVFTNRETSQAYFVYQTMDYFATSSKTSVRRKLTITEIDQYESTWVGPSTSEIGVYSEDQNQTVIYLTTANNTYKTNVQIQFYNMIGVTDLSITKQ